MQKKLGLQITPTSVSWALVQTGDNGHKKLVRSGIRQFKDATEHTQQGEKPSAQERTRRKGMRRLHRRHRNRKADLLKVLVRERMCPAVPEADIRYWRLKKVFPDNADLREWLNVNAAEGKNPYNDRHECLHRRLDLSEESDRFILGRALYHLSQRRGYISNSKTDRNDDESNKKESAIRRLTEEMQQSGFRFLGDYFFAIIGKKRIRSRELSRKEHILAEFEEICSVQQLDEALVNELRSCIFRSAPVKSQKWTVGHCVYEKDKPRIKTSHPLFEEFRLLQTIANFKIQTPDDERLRPLTDDEKDRILPLFFRKSKPNFDFAEVASALSGVKAPKNPTGKQLGDCIFNYHLDQSIPGCPVTAAIISALDDADYRNWKSRAAAQYVRAKQSDEDAVNDIWHTLEFYDDTDMEVRWFMDNLGLTEKAATSLAKTRLPDTYATLSAKAIRRIIPFLRQGTTLYKAVYLANLDRCVPQCSEAMLQTVRENVSILIDDFHEDRNRKKENLQDNIRDYLLSIPDSKPDNLWIPNEMENFVPVFNERTGRLELPSPVSPALKNPLVIRCIAQAGQVINQLLRDGIIDNKTEISFCLNEGINSRNMRKAITDFQKNNRKKRDEIIKALDENGIAVSEANILRYRLWDEQKHLDILSGQQISLSDAFDGGKAMLENIVPLAMGGNNSPENLLLVTKDTYDRKHGNLCTQVFNREDILDTVKLIGWDDTVRTLERHIFSNTKTAKSATMKESKDRAIAQRNLNELTLAYWKSKTARLTADKPYNDCEKMLSGRYGSIGKFLKKYLAAIFKDIYTCGPDGIREFRRMWGIPSKDGSGYGEALLDAITAACIDGKQYTAFCQYMADMDARKAYGRPLEPMPLPWSTFTEDANDAVSAVLSSSYSENNIRKNSKFKMRDSRGKIICNKDGEPIYKTGSGARESLHNDTYLGMINNHGEMAYVTRVPAESITEKNVGAIVDPELRDKFIGLLDTYGSVQKAIEEGAMITSPDGFPIRHVRKFNRAQNSIILKKHPERSRFDYKRNIYVTNEENDTMIIEGDSFTMVNNLDAARQSATYDGSGKILKKKTLVLFYDKDKSELRDLSRTELSKRLYKIESLGYQLIFRHHLDIRSECDKGCWLPDGTAPACFKKTYNKINFAVEGQDFIINRVGEIKFLFR